LKFMSARSEATRAKILKAAEALFAQRGVSQTSLRAITTAAKVNMAAVNYHFGSKEALSVEVFREVARRANTRRLELLEAVRAKARAEKRPLSVDEVVDSFIHPYLDDADPAAGRLLAHLVMLRRVNPPPWSEEVARAEFDDMAQRFVDALAEASGLELTECYWRYYFMVSTVVLSVSDSAQAERFLDLSSGSCDPSDRAQMRSQLRAFLVSAFQRPE